jgi:hypothetical protein
MRPRPHAGRFARPASPPRNFYKNSQTANPGIPAGDAEGRSEQITGRLIPVPEDGAAAEATAYVRRRRILRSCVCAQPFYFEKRTWIVPPSTALSRPSEIANRRQLGSPESDRAWPGCKPCSGEYGAGHKVPLSSEFHHRLACELPSFCRLMIPHAGPCESYAAEFLRSGLQ